MECNDLPNDVFEDSDKVKTKDNNKVPNKDNQVRRKPKLKTIDKHRNDNELEETEDEEMDDIAVILHEDVPDSLFGGGDSVEEDIDMVVENENEDTVDGVDEVDEPADLVPASDDDVDSDPDDPDPDGPDPRLPLRKSVRFSKAPKLFSYNEIGGPPVLIDVKSKR